MTAAADDVDSTLVIVAEIDGALRREGGAAEALVLEAYGWTAEQYRAGKARVGEIIRAESTKGDAEQVARYVAAFRRMHGARIFSLDSEHLAKHVGAPGGEGAPLEEGPVAAPAVAVPTYLVPHAQAVAIKDTLDTTLEVRLDALRPATPFAVAEERTWTVAQYASLCAEETAPRGLSPERRAAYGFADEAAIAALHTAWRRRLEAQPELHAEWARLVAQYRTWLASLR